MGSTATFPHLGDQGLWALVDKTSTKTSRQPRPDLDRSHAPLTTQPTASRGRVCYRPPAVFITPPPSSSLSRASFFTHTLQPFPPPANQLTNPTLAAARASTQPRPLHGSVDVFIVTNTLPGARQPEPPSAAQPQPGKGDGAPR